MPCAWEIAEANQILIGILHVDVTTVAWAFGLRNLAVPGKEEHRRFNPFLPLSGMPYDMARNVLCQKVLELKCTWACFLDSDVIPPRDAFIRLINHRKPIMSGVYARRSPPHALPVMIRNGQWVTQYPPNSIIEVDFVGAGCLVIHRTVLEQLPPGRLGKRWFDWKVDLKGLKQEGEGLSEDFEFCRRAKTELGVPTLVDTSVVCRHVGACQATPGNFVPLETCPVT